MIGGGARVDPHHRAGRVQRIIEECGAGVFPVLGRDPILEVEDHESAAAAAFSNRSGLSSAGFLRTMVLRDAVATISPC